MRRDHRPYRVKKAFQQLEALYVRHFLEPQLEFLGPGHTFMRPWHVEVFGHPVAIGRCANVLAAPDHKVRLAVWSARQGQGYIRVGDYCLICPGVRIQSAVGIDIGDNCMLASQVYITDSDWHDLYNRIRPCLKPARVRIEENVWVGDSSIICKGVSIGKNSVIGAGSVVVQDVPPNVVAAGNPARVVRELDRDEPMITRAAWFEDYEKLTRDIELIDREMLKNNTFFNWIRHIFFPRAGD